MINPILPIFCVSKVSANLSEIAIIVALGSLASALAKFITGFLVEARRSLEVLLCGLILFTISNYLYLIVSNPQNLMVVRFVHGISFGVIVTLALSLVSLIAGKGRRGRSISLYLGFVALGLMAGPAVGSIIIEFWSLEDIFYILSLLGLVPIFLVLYLVNVNRRGYGRNIDKPRHKIQKLFFKHDMIIPLFAYLTYAIFFGTLNTYMPIYLNIDLELSAQSVSAIFFGLFLFAAIVRLKLDYIVKKMGDTTGMICGFLNYICLSLLIYTIPIKNLIISSVVLIGLSHGIIFPLLAIRVSRIVPYENLISANSLFLIAFDIGVVIGPTSTSILADYYSIPLAIIASLLPALVILPLIIYQARAPSEKMG